MSEAVKRVKLDPKMEEKAVNTIRILSADTVEKANSGHPGAPMGCAPLAYTLFTKYMKYNPKDPKFFNRDRFVLSNGHACALQYSVMHLVGYDRPTLDDLKNFRQIDSVTAGHPENELLDGVEVSTGPLGQGICNAVGMAIAERHLAANFNKPGFDVIDNYTYVICGDGCLQEGVSCEASSLAGHLGLGKLIVLYDDNKITIDGETELSFTEDVLKRYEAYGWHTQTVTDGNRGTAELEKAIDNARAVTDKPSIIKVATIIGFGSKKEGKESVHGAPLGAEDLANVKTKFGFNPEESFAIPEDVLGYFREQVTTGAATQGAWNELFAKYKAEFPELAAELQRRIDGKFPENWADKLPRFTPADGKIASRNSSEKVLNACAAVLPELMGGSADLTGSNKTHIKGSTDFQAKTPEGRYMRFGVREHGMAAICNGMAAYGGFIPFGATFLNFAGYALGAIRLSALSGFRVLYIMTHDSIGLGEDGPTHQPVGMLLSCRSIPNFYVFRPADANEVSGSYKAALELTHSPSLFSLSRQNLPCLEGSSPESVAMGAYTVSPSADPKVVLVATGSEVYIAIEAAEILRKEGVSAAVVSMPCWKLFDKQSPEYKATVFPAGVPVVSVEAASVEGWAKYSHAQVGLKTFGKSGPYLKVYEDFGITGPAIAEKCKNVVKYFSDKTPTHLVGMPEF